MFSDAENTMKDDEFFTDTVDTPKGSVDQHNKQECLKSAESKGKVSNNQRKNIFTRQQRLQRLTKLATKPSIKFMLNANNVN